MDVPDRLGVQALLQLQVVDEVLEDTPRDAIESEDKPDCLELVPSGKKDWIVGRRIGSSIQFSKLDEIFQSVLKQLLTLESYQRIRRESIRVYSVIPPVPVFTDDLSISPIEESKEQDSEQKNTPEGPTTCPICKREVHSYNLQYDPTGRVVGCYICRGEANL